MGSSLSCLNGNFKNVAIVIPIDGQEPIYWPTPSLAFDVAVNHPGHKVVKASKLAKKGVAAAMYFGDSLKPKKLYFLVPCDKEGAIHIDSSILRHLKKGAKKFLKNKK